MWHLNAASAIEDILVVGRHWFRCRCPLSPFRRHVAASGRGRSLGGTKTSTPEMFVLAVPSPLVFLHCPEYFVQGVAALPPMSCNYLCIVALFRIIINIFTGVSHTHGPGWARLWARRGRTLPRRVRLLPPSASQLDRLLLPSTRPPPSQK